MSATKDHKEQNDRLDRIESKLDSMSEAIISLARAEEKITTLAKYSETQASQILKIVERLESLEQKVSSNEIVVNVINKLFWIVLTGIIGGVTGMYLMQ
jgi:tetrahydromethanopterin S-methyltransferase subunit G|tara:strand:+ start:17 stop:313 length:297 start_codon:yes stop_codon:yes gene_type:complete